MTSLNVLTIPATPASNGELANPMNSTNGSHEGGEGFKQLLSQTVSQKSTGAPTATKAAPPSNNAVKAADKKPSVKQADVDAATDVAQDPILMTNPVLFELNVETMGVKPLKETLAETDYTTVAAVNTDSNAALLAALQLPVMGVKPIEPPTESTSDVTRDVTSANLAVTMSTPQKGVATLEEKLDEKPANMQDGLDRDAPEKNEPSIPLTQKADQFSEHVLAKMSEKIQVFQDKASPVGTDKPRHDAQPSLLEITTVAALAAAITSTQTPAELASSQVISQPLGQAGWHEAVNQKVVWMLGTQAQTATLTLNPPDLGPLQVVVSVNNEQADATFMSDNPDVRKALEDGLSDLRAQLDQAGVALGEANIGSHDQFQQARQQQAERWATPVNSLASIAPNQIEPMSARPVQVRESLGLVDTFA